MEYKIFFKKSAFKELSKIDKSDLPKIKEAINLLATDPNKIKHNIKKIKTTHYLRLKVGSYRVIFSKENNFLTIYILRVAHRKEVYRNIW